MTELLALRDAVRAHHRADETVVLDYLTTRHAPSPELRTRIRARAVRVIEDVRAASGPTLMESFLGQYGLSSDEGLALMTLAEALLRVPDAETIDDLIEDKISPANWREHFGKSENTLVNASTFALSMTQSVLEASVSKGPLDAVRGAIKRLGEPVIRAAVRRAMKELGNQFVLGETMKEALKRSRKWAAEGATFSYDMLGEAALTFPDADQYFAAYIDAIRAIAAAARSDDMRENPGLSIKLSALYPRYEMSKADECVPALADRVLELAYAARDARIGLNIDAEEAHRLGLSLNIIELVLSDHGLAGWDGLGVVVQAFGKRASFVIDWLYGLAQKHDRKIMVRLVKGAYWDSEIKRAQVEGVPDFPVFTSKAATDISYICCAAQLLKLTDRIYPQFATHNAHSVAAILEMAGNRDDFEFQRLHGMGEPLHGALLSTEKVRSRIYAPVGRHRELLAYLVRRLLENGANSSFVNQLANHAVPAEAIAADPFEQLDAARSEADRKIICPNALYAPERINSRGWDLANRADLNGFLEARAAFAETQWHAAPIIAGDLAAANAERAVYNPSNPDRQIGTVRDATAEQAASAIAAARIWDVPVAERAAVLTAAADLLEAHHGEIFALLAREAGKSAPDAIAELREAVDFLRYYAAQAAAAPASTPRGIISCISPWNFPLAIFTGQIAAALAMGNAVLAKPAEQTPLIAHLATRLLHQAGVPAHALQLLPGPGQGIGTALTGDAAIAGTCFTGSTATAQAINRNMAARCAPGAMLIAETGGINAMIVDSTALPEQAVRDIVSSAFQSAGQRCSALRMLYVQSDIADSLKAMLFGAMDALTLGDPWWLANDVGPVIDPVARDRIAAHIDAARRDGRLLKHLDVPENGWFIGPVAISVSGIDDLAEEIFGPVLHIATFEAGEIDALVDRINAARFGLTFGLQTRIDSRIEAVTARIHAGNVYVNRNQIGAVVGTQPFGGEGLSGTGPKAGGPRYLPRFTKAQGPQLPLPPLNRLAGRAEVEAALAALPHVTDLALDSLTMPGPTGESNVLSSYPRGRILCLGPSLAAATEQARIARAQGCAALIVVPGAKGAHALNGFIERANLAAITGFDGVAVWSEQADQRAIGTALASRDGAIIALLTEDDFAARCVHERHVCIDTTAAGGNVSLLA